MPGIEFVDDDDPAAGADDPALRPAPAEDAAVVRTRSLGAALLAVAAALLVAASFVEFYRLSYVSRVDGDVQDETVDARGNVRFRVRSGITGQHATNYAAALCVLATVLLAVAVVTGLPRIRGVWPARARRWSRVVTLATLGVAGGLLTAAGLELRAQRETSAAFSDGDIRLHQSVGASVWLQAAALVVGAGALVAPLIVRRRGPVGVLAGEPRDGRPGEAQADLPHG